jgi:hypothetical protein
VAIHAVNTGVFGISRPAANVDDEELIIGEALKLWSPEGWDRGDEG